MAEQPIFWAGGAPGATKNNKRKAPEAEGYEPAIRDACVGCGYAVDEYVAAQGGFGGWLAHIERGGQRFRIFWSGKDKQLIFERAQGAGGWYSVASEDAADESVPAFVEALKIMLAEDQGAA